MHIQKLSAVFGQREIPPLDFSPGLNVLKAPSRESAALWTALLQDALLGPAPGQPPRSAASRCCLEAATPWGTLAIARWTADGEAPLTGFSAVYASGAGPAPYLTPAGCTETLMGVSREVFDNLAVIHSPAPGDSQQAMTDLRAHAGCLEEDRTEQAQLEARAVQLRSVLERHDAAARREAALAAEQAHLDFASARDKLKTMEAGKKPPPTKAELTALRASLDGLEAQAGPIRMARQRADQAEKALRLAEAALEAQEPPEPPLEESEPRPKAPLYLLGCAALAGGGLAAAMWALSRSWLAAAGGGLGLLGLLALVIALFLLRKQKAWEERRAGREERRALAGDSIAALTEDVERARRVFDEATGAYDNVTALYRAGLERVLTGVRSFRPFARDVEDARQAIAAGLVLRRELDAALAELEEARARWDRLKKHAVYPLPPPVRRPAEPREPLERELEEAEGRLEALQGRFSDALEGCAREFLARMEQEEDEELPLYLAARLAGCCMLLPGSVPVILEPILDQMDGGALSRALDLLVELSQTRQVLLLTSLDQAASALRRTHPDRFRVVTLR